MLLFATFSIFACKIGCVKSFTVKFAHKCDLQRINATFAENKCNFLALLLQQKLALVIRICLCISLLVLQFCCICSITNFKDVLFTMGVSKESISKFLIGNRFHVKLRIQGLRMRNFTWNRFPIKICWLIPCLHPSWKVHMWIKICASLNHRKKTKVDGSRLIPWKHTETLVLLSVILRINVLQIADWMCSFTTRCKRGCNSSNGIKMLHL